MTERLTGSRGSPIAIKLLADARDSFLSFRNASVSPLGWNPRLYSLSRFSISPLVRTPINPTASRSYFLKDLSSPPPMTNAACNSSHLVFSRRFTQLERRRASDSVKREFGRRNRESWLCTSAVESPRSWKIRKS